MVGSSARDQIYRLRDFWKLAQHLDFEFNPDELDAQVAELLGIDSAFSPTRRLEHATLALIQLRNVHKAEFHFRTAPRAEGWRIFKTHFMERTPAWPNHPAYYKHYGNNFFAPGESFCHTILFYSDKIFKKIG